MTSVGWISFPYRPGLLCPSAVLWLAVGTPSVRSSTPESDGPCFAPKNHKPIPAPPIPIAAIKASRLRPNCRMPARLGICERTCALGYLGCGTIPSIRSVYIPIPGKTLGKNDGSMHQVTNSPARVPPSPPQAPSRRPDRKMSMAGPSQPNDLPRTSVPVETTTSGRVAPRS
jgi:hypothetical protein